MATAIPPFIPGPSLPACTPPLSAALPTCSPPRIYAVGSSPYSINRAETGVPYVYQFIDAGGAPITSWTFSGLPGWLTEVADGRIAGTPVAAAPADTFDVTATTSCGSTHTITASIQVD